MEGSTRFSACGTCSNPYKDVPVNILFLSASSGGGHHAVAQSLTHLIANVQQANFHTIDLYADKRLQPYPKIATMRAKAPWAWASLLQVTDNRQSIDALWYWFRPSFSESLKRQLDTAAIDKPDIIIATHHASAQCLESVAQSYGGNRPKTVVFVTDYDAHQNWVAAADLYVVASAKAFKRLKKQGKQVIQAPLLPCTSYMADELPAAMQASMFTASPSLIEKRLHRFKLIAVMGLDGTSERKLMRLLNSLDKQTIGQQLSIDIICGKNKQLYQALAQYNWVHLEVNSFGFVTDLPERLERADLALLRLSPQIMTEALVAKTPIIAFDWHFHERENVQLLRTFGAGNGSRHCSRQIYLIKRFCHNAGLREQWQQAANDISEQRVASDFIEKMFTYLKALPTRNDQPVRLVDKLTPVFSKSERVD